MNSFRFSLGEGVALSLSAEQGVVIGRAEFDRSENTYLVRYCDVEGCQGERWFSESALVAK